MKKMITDNQTNKPPIGPSPAHRRKIWPLAAAFTAILACSLAPRALAQASVTFTVDTTLSDGTGISPYMAADRIGIANVKPYSTYNPGGLQYFWAATNTQLISLYQNAGIRLISVGGLGADSQVPQPDPTWLGPFFSFCQAANIQGNWLLGMSNINNAGSMSFTNSAMTNALYIMQNYSNNLAWLSIGNERDAKTSDSDHGWGTGWTAFTEYWPNWRAYRDDITAYCKANGAPVPWFGGPDAVNDDSNWDEYFANTNLAVYGDYVSDMNFHWEPLSHSTNDTSFEDAVNMLSSNIDDTDFPSIANGWVNYQNYAYPASITEFNSYNFTGGNGATNNYGSQTYANALFGLDAIHWWAQAGLHSLDWLDAQIGTGVGFFYTNVSNGDLEGCALMYGCAAYNEGGGADAYTGYINNNNMGLVAPIPVLTNSAGVDNVTAYAIADYGADGHCTNLYVTIINTSMANPPSGRWATNILADFNVNMPYPGVTTLHRMYLSQAQSYVTATNGITLGGADLNGGGSFQPQWINEGVLNYPYYKTTVTNLTAQILEFSCPTN
jgi:hypothetical protein